MKQNKGIALIALVSIIVALIVVATISVILIFGENGFIKKSEQAKNETIVESNNRGENTGGSLGNNTSSKWTYNRETQTVTNGAITLNIGDYVNYDHKTGITTASYTSEEEKNEYGNQTFNVADYNYGWRVLGTDESGQLLLIAEDFVPGSMGTTVGERKFFYLGNRSIATTGPIAYANAETELKNICEIFGQGVGAIGARSVTVEDINIITGYDPNIAGYVDKLNPTNQYGNEVTYTLTAEGVSYVGTKHPTTLATSHYSSFIYYKNGKLTSLEIGESSEPIKSTYYYYAPDRLKSTTNGKIEGIEKTSTAYKMLFTNSSTGAYSEREGTSSQFNYWLSSLWEETSEGLIRFGVRAVESGAVYGPHFFDSRGFNSSSYCGVRPVVTLASDVSLTNSNTTRDGCVLWNIN